ncbi:MAG: D-glycero-beta-D-manno-heptose 1,7-bisphosphate 7-phosphatase [Candidatus Omnitrophica bacterium]|nr:D-glycero-beta-D-manno-heptose 1,7-bisphosphate 7-phosphatase [Candidatus Omnitrophota bacterium]
MNDRYVFLDRDGVINKDPGGWTEYGYVTVPDNFMVIPGAHEGIKILTDAGYNIVIISNQQGVGKGYFSRRELDAVTAKMLSGIKNAGGVIKAVYYCTHLTSDDCECKKPKPGMFLRAKKELNIDILEGKYFVGDTERDIQAGKAAGLKTILVLTGKSTRDDAANWEYKPDMICKDLTEAAKTIIESDMK